MTLFTEMTTEDQQIVMNLKPVSRRALYFDIPLSRERNEAYRLVLMVGLAHSGTHTKSVVEQVTAKENS